MQHFSGFHALLNMSLELFLPQYKLVYYADDAVSNTYIFLEDTGDMEKLVTIKPYMQTKVGKKKVLRFKT